MTDDAPLLVQPTGTSHGGWRTLRLALVVVWLFTAVTAFVLHERPATLVDLYAAVSDGRVDRVRLVGGLPPGATGGYGDLTAHWRDGSVRRVLTLTIARPIDEAPLDRADHATTIDLAAEIADRNGSVRVDQIDFERGLTWTILGSDVPAAVGGAWLAVALTSLVLLIAGPEPWRATRWAWFWLTLPVFGSIFFLLLSGPTPGLPAPREGRRRLTGGWAFLLSLALPGPPGP